MVKNRLPKERRDKKKDQNVIKQSDGKGYREAMHNRKDGSSSSLNDSMTQDPGDNHSAMTDPGGSIASNFDDRQSFVSSSTLAGYSVGTGDETIIRRGDGAIVRPTTITNLSIPAEGNKALNGPTSPWSQGQNGVSDNETGHIGGVRCRCICM